MKKPRLGLEITPQSIRCAVLSDHGSGGAEGRVIKADLPAGMIASQFQHPNILDYAAFSELLRGVLSNAAPGGRARVALTLPDSVFRVQTLEFDELPASSTDRDKLIRWRLEKAAAFDTAEIVLRRRFFKKRDKGYSVLACAAKQAVIRQYERLLADLGVETWSVGMSSLHVLDYYAGTLFREGGASAALAVAAEDSFSTMVTDREGLRFYRFKELKKSGPVEARDRLAREIEDSLHFYTHLDPARQSELSRLFIAGESSELVLHVAEGLRTMTSVDVEMLSPAGDAPPDAVAALGAGSGL